MTKGISTGTDILEITVHQGDEASAVRLRGRFNIDSSPSLRDELLVILHVQSPKAVIVDLTDVTYIDSSGIATLIEALKIARNRHRRLCLQGLQGRLRHLFQVTGVSALFETADCQSVTSATKVS